MFLFLAIYFARNQFLKKSDWLLTNRETNKISGRWNLLRNKSEKIQLETQLKDYLQLVYEISKSEDHSCQTVPNPLFYEDSLYCLPPFHLF